MMDSAGPGVYVHIPFCVQRCFYCAFAVTLDPAPAWNPYVRRVGREIEIAGWDSPPGTVYFGGGTPSLVSPEEIAFLLKAVGGAPGEVSLEANPGTMSFEKMRRYREIGVTRISLGAQSLEDADLRIAGRLHAASDVRSDFESLRRAGCDNINLDLIAGLPGQQFGTWTGVSSGGRSCCSASS
jgi:oxygen-independent coproporphyrinogen-3 oxidase